jgi:predicted AAA+ superfamily ATPase
MIERPRLTRVVTDRLDSNAVVTLLGPRQCGKTTLARTFPEETVAAYFDLEDPADLNRLANPMLALEHLQGFIIIDEVQRQPDVFPILRVLADRTDYKANFLLLGSASLHLIKGVSESLAGRVSFVEMSGFTLEETGYDTFRNLWLRGFFPRSFLSSNEEESFQWRVDFTKTFLERDIPQLGISIPSSTLRRFWSMVAHFHGQIWNASEFARSLGSSEASARRYLDLLSGTYMVRQLQPWFENISKRQVKSPKVYIRDSGILHTLLGIQSETVLMGHPKLGASWEGFALEQVLQLLQPLESYFWATHGGAELDLFMQTKGERVGFEFQFADAPKMTKSMRVAMEDLRLDKLWIVYPGRKSYPLHTNVEVLSVLELDKLK